MQAVPNTCCQARSQIAHRSIPDEDRDTVLVAVLVPASHLPLRRGDDFNRRHKNVRDDGNAKEEPDERQAVRNCTFDRDGGECMCLAS